MKQSVDFMFIRQQDQDIMHGLQGIMNGMPPSNKIKHRNCSLISCKLDVDYEATSRTPLMWLGWVMLSQFYPNKRIMSNFGKLFQIIHIERAPSDFERCNFMNMLYWQDPDFSADLYFMKRMQTVE